MTCASKAGVSLGAHVSQCELFLKSLVYSLKVSQQNCLLNYNGEGGEG